MLPSLSLGPVRVAPALVLSPMSGVTDMAFRRLVRECSPAAVGLVVSEFVSIEGLTRNDLKSHRMLRYHRCEHPVAVQVFGADIDRMAEAAAIVQQTGVDAVEINCGCPVPKVVKRGGGAELMRRPAHLERMLRAVRRELSVPLTLKIRAGWDRDSINCVEVAQLAEAAGVAMLTVHGRTRTQLYTGAADWQVIAAVKQAVAIPVAGSGDVVTVATARERWRSSAVDALAIGRGAMENPWLFAQIAADFEGRSRPQPAVADRLAALRRYRELLDELYPEKVTAARLRGMACRLVKGFSGSAALREAVTRTRGTRELLDVLERFERAPAPAAVAGAAAGATSARDETGGVEVAGARRLAAAGAA